MANWTPRQKFIFLAYLLALNFVVFGALSYLVAEGVLLALFAPSSEPAARYATPTAWPTRTPFSLPTAKPSATLASQSGLLRENLVAVTFTPTPPNRQAVERTTLSAATMGDSLQRPPILPESQSATAGIAIAATAKQQIRRLGTATPTRVPSLTSTPTKTSTLRPSPTVTQPATSTPAQTSTPRPTLSPTATKTATAFAAPAQLPPVIQGNQVRPTVKPSAIPEPLPTSVLGRASSLSPLQEAAPAAVAVSALPRDSAGISDSQVPAAHPLQSEQALFKRPEPAEIITLPDRRLALSWAAKPEIIYQIYSDMGRGYGLYIYRAETAGATFTETRLATEAEYQYRIRPRGTGEWLVEATLTGPAQAASLSQTSKANLPPLRVTPAPTALPPDTVLLGLLSDNKFTDEFNILTIAGEVRNDSSLDVGQSQITVNFYNSSGAVIQTTAGKTMLEIIPPGETSPFLITLPRPAGMTSYSLRAVAQPVTPKLSPQLSVIETRRFEDEAGFFHIKGVVKNAGDLTAERAKVAAIIYGRDGRVINVGFTSLVPATLSPGEVATYDIVFTYYPRYVTQKVIAFEE